MKATIVNCFKLSTDSATLEVVVRNMRGGVVCRYDARNESWHGGDFPSEAARAHFLGDAVLTKAEDMASTLLINEGF